MTLQEVLRDFCRFLHNRSIYRWIINRYVNGTRRLNQDYWGELSELVGGEIDAYLLRFPVDQRDELWRMCQTNQDAFTLGVKNVIELARSKRKQ